jgi:hypothetical protein
VKKNNSLGIALGTLIIVCGTPLSALAYCQNSNAAAQQLCLAQEAQQQRAQQQAQQQAQMRAQQEAQQRAQQEAQQRAQQEAQQRTQQQAQQRQQEAQKQARPPTVQPQGAQPHTAQSPSRPADRPSSNVPPHAAVKAESNSPSREAHPAGKVASDARPPNRSEPPAPHSPQAVAPRPVQINATTVTSAYVLHHEANGGRSKTYLDGRKVVYATNGDIARTSPHRVTVVTHKSGLRQAALADGRPIFREHIEHVMHGSVSREVVVRTEYARVVVGSPVFYAAPVIRRYEVASYYGYPVLAYQPTFFSPFFFNPFLVSFAQPVVVTPLCVFCPAPVVAWQQPVASYSDPVDLVADMQITSAVQDGMADAPSATLDASGNQKDPQVAELRAQVDTMQQQVDAATQSNADLRDQVAALQQSSAPQATTAFAVPEAVRQQIHQQVRDNIRLHQQKRALTWPDVVASGEASNYIFQVSDLLDATDSGGEECPLTAGDLLKLDAGAAPDQEILSMRVVTSKSGSCPAGSSVSVSIHDAQGMLNDFNQRQEANMQKLAPQIAAANRG